MAGKKIGQHLKCTEEEEEEDGEEEERKEEEEEEERRRRDLKVVFCYIRLLFF